VRGGRYSLCSGTTEQRGVGSRALMAAKANQLEERETTREDERGVGARISCSNSTHSFTRIPHRRQTRISLVWLMKGELHICDRGKGAAGSGTVGNLNFLFALIHQRLFAASACTCAAPTTGVSDQGRGALNEGVRRAC
jgi:hypothetical protein